MNLRALTLLLPELKATAVEINEKASKICAEIPRVSVINDSIYNFSADEQFDLTFTSGVLIHINPGRLGEVYDKLYKYSKKYILISEYYNPTPVEVNYRGNADRLFKRDFAGEFMDKYTDTKLIDYGFFYHRDKQFPNDDTTWFLMEKS